MLNSLIMTYVSEQVITRIHALLLTCCRYNASDSSIFGVSAVVAANAVAGAIDKSSLRANAAHIVQQDGRECIALAKCSKRDGNST